ncbi:hypothetical protein GJ496_003581 [Pomphorhynchus laevis]|nr:hypothetical protein GJ496_003581 [Pomphorhynchus laevis]
MRQGRLPLIISFRSCPSSAIVFGNIVSKFVIAKRRRVGERERAAESTSFNRQHFISNISATFHRHQDSFHKCQECSNPCSTILSLSRSDNIPRGSKILDRFNNQPNGNSMRVHNDIGSSSNANKHCKDELANDGNDQLHARDTGQTKLWISDTCRWCRYT